MDGPALELPYLVLRIKEDVIACGGLQLLDEGETAFLTWGMVAQPYHGRGIGRILTEARLNLARQTTGIAKVTLHTSQHTKGFYEMFGFVPFQCTPNGYGPGLDRWDMALQLV